MSSCANGNYFELDYSGSICNFFYGVSGSDSNASAGFVSLILAQKVVLAYPVSSTLKTTFLSKKIIFSGHQNALSALVSSCCLGQLNAAFPVSVGHCQAASFPHAAIRQAVAANAGGAYHFLNSSNPQKHPVRSNYLEMPFDLDQGK